jgi:hypothetical protein
MGLGIKNYNIFFKKPNIFFFPEKRMRAPSLQQFGYYF